MGGCYRGEGRIWKDREVSGIRIHNVKSPKKQLKITYIYIKELPPMTQLEVSAMGTFDRLTEEQRVRRSIQELESFKGLKALVTRVAGLRALCL